MHTVQYALYTTSITVPLLEETGSVQYALYTTIIAVPLLEETGSLWYALHTSSITVRLQGESAKQKGSLLQGQQGQLGQGGFQFR